MAVTPPTDVVVPVHNRWELTESCLAHLRSQSIPHRLIVVDNASTDETRERIASYYPEASVVAFELNRGFSVACNSGVEAGDGEIVVLLNNDVECRPDFLERLIAPLAENDGVGMVAALLVRPGEETIESFGLTADRTLAGFPRLRGVGAGDAQADTPLLVGPAGAGGAYRRRAWEAVGGLDEGVFAYGEDVDLALRLGAAGWSAAAAPDAVAVHIGSASAISRSAWQRYQGGFSRGYFLRRHGVLRSRAAVRAVVTEAVVVLGDALVFSHDLAALRGRVAGWRTARGKPRTLRGGAVTIDTQIGFLRSLRLRVGVYREPRSVV